MCKYALTTKENVNQYKKKLKAFSQYQSDMGLSSLTEKLELAQIAQLNTNRPGFKIF